jgi:hypothetical protein
MRCARTLAGRLCVPSHPDTAASKIENTRQMAAHLWLLTMRVR